MNVTLASRNLYEDFILEQDILYFRLKDRGVVSFHGKNFNIKRRLTTEQLDAMLAGNDFFKVNTDCFANLKKIEMIHDNRVYFDPKVEECKSVSVTKLRQSQLKEFLIHNRFDPSAEDSLK